MSERSISIQVLEEIEDRLFPMLALDVWERSLYYHLLRQTRIRGSDAAVLPLTPLAKATAMSDVKARETIRQLDSKGCIRIEDRTKNGHLVRVFLPDEIERLRHIAAPSDPVDVDKIDFYEDRRHRPVILRREGHACFYCRRKVTEDTVALDHVIAVSSGGANSHRNIVAACNECNSLKQAVVADEFLRRLYRDGVLSQVDLKDRLERLAALQGGLLSAELVW